MKARAWWASLLVAGSVLTNCGGDEPTPSGQGPDASTDSGGSSGASGQAPGGGSSGASGTPGGGDQNSCTTRFVYAPKPNEVVSSVRVTGEWNGFATDGPALSQRADGSFEGEVLLPEGRVGYKLLINGEYQLDPRALFRKYVDGVENSAVEVEDCEVPTLVRSGDFERSRAGAGQGRVQTSVQVRRGASADRQPEQVRAKLLKDFTEQPGLVFDYDAATGRGELSAEGLSDGKYTLVVEAEDQQGRRAKPLRLVFWIEAERFDWRDAVMYMTMNDRIKNGDPSNDQAPIGGVDARVQFQGGDLEGVRQLIASGYLDQLGIRAIWLSPFHQNPAGEFAGSGGHDVTGYHGYWPTHARKVDDRLGGATALRAMVKEAHAHGIRVLQDFVLNHVHEDHEYVAAHPDWFRTSCVCGTDGCGWTERRLDCLFTPYLPDVNWSVTEASKQMEDDAAFWIDSFDLDGLRVDAVKHVEDLAVINLSGALRQQFEQSGEKLFLTGETAMGWSDCTAEPGCIGNEENYGTISRYMGPGMLDGQFDFVLHHAAPLSVFAEESRSLYHADFWAHASQVTYPAGSLMTPYIGSHDTPRFLSHANASGGNPHNQWDDVAQKPSIAEPYERMKLALAWLFSLPGVPLLYYGDEYGQWGGADPNNRHFFREGAALDTRERGLLDWTRKLGQARLALAPLRRGELLLTPYQNDGLSVTVRRTEAGEIAVVVLTRHAQTVDVTLPLGATVPNGTVLRDQLSNATVTVQGNAFSLTMPAHGAAYLGL